MAVLTLLIAGCSKPEEVISRRLTQANQNLDAGRVDDAIKTLENLNQTYIDQPAVLEALGFAYVRAGQHVAAANSFMRAADSDPQSASLRQLAAESYFQANEIDQAEQQFRLYVDEFPADYRAREKIGQIEEQSGDLVRALDEYLECYRLRPSGEYAWRVGSVFRRLNNAPQTKSWFETTIKHGEGHVEEALVGLLELELNSRDFAAASRTVDQLDRIYPGTLDQTPLVSAREELATWRTQQQALEAARTSQQSAAREIEQERRRQESELAALANPPAETPPPAPPANTVPTTAPGATRPAADPTTPPPALPGPAPEPTADEPAATEIAATPATVAPAAETAAAPETTPGRSLPPDLRAALAYRDRGDNEGALAALWSIIANSDQRVDAWLELGHTYRTLLQFDDAEACLLEAARRAPDNVEVTIATLEVVRAAQPRDVYFARLERARQSHPGNADLAYFFARELASLEGAVARAVSAYEDFLLLAPVDDPRRRDATAYLTRVRGY